MSAVTVTVRKVKYALSAPSVGDELLSSVSPFVNQGIFHGSRKSGEIDYDELTRGFSMYNSGFRLQMHNWLHRDEHSRQRWYVQHDRRRELNDSQIAAILSHPPQPAMRALSEPRHPKVKVTASEGFIKSLRKLDADLEETALRLGIDNAIITPAAAFHNHRNYTICDHVIVYSAHVSTLGAGAADVLKKSFEWASSISDRYLCLFNIFPAETPTSAQDEIANRFDAALEVMAMYSSGSLHTSAQLSSYEAVKSKKSPSPPAKNPKRANEVAPWIFVLSNDVLLTHNKRTIVDLLDTLSMKTNSPSVRGLSEAGARGNQGDHDGMGEGRIVKHADGSVFDFLHFDKVADSHLLQKITDRVPSWMESLWHAFFPKQRPVVIPTKPVPPTKSLPFRPEPGDDTVEDLICHDINAGKSEVTTRDRISCNAERQTPHIDDYSVFVFTSAEAGNVSFGKGRPQLTGAAIAFRPSSAAAFFADAIRRGVRDDYLGLGRDDSSLLSSSSSTSESIRDSDNIGDSRSLGLLVDALVQHITGLFSSDMAKICGSVSDADRNYRRMHDACEFGRRLLAHRQIDPARFSASRPGADEDGPLAGGALSFFNVQEGADAGDSVKNAGVIPAGAAVQHQRQPENKDVVRVLQTVSKMWLNPTGGVIDTLLSLVDPSASLIPDYHVVGPNRIGVFCGKALGGSACPPYTTATSQGLFGSSSLDFTPHLAFQCGDIVADFSLCGIDQFFTHQFRLHMGAHGICALYLPWTTSNAGQGFTLSNFIDEDVGEFNKSAYPVYLQHTPVKGLNPEQLDKLVQAALEKIAGASSTSPAR